MKNTVLKISSPYMRMQFIREELKKLENSLGISLSAIVYDPEISTKFQTPGLGSDRGSSTVVFEDAEGEKSMYWVKIYSDFGEIPHAFAALGVIEGDNFDLPEPVASEPEQAKVPPQAAQQLVDEWKQRNGF